MREIVYQFKPSNMENDNVEAKKYYMLAAEKAPALGEAVKFMLDGFHGLNPEISEKTLDDAFECAINRDKFIIYSGSYPSDQKKMMADKAELSRKLMREGLKSWLTVKGENQQKISEK